MDETGILTRVQPRNTKPGGWWVNTNVTTLSATLHPFLKGSDPCLSPHPKQQQTSVPQPHHHRGSRRFFYFSILKPASHREEEAWDRGAQAAGVQQVQGGQHAPSMGSKATTVLHEVAVFPATGTSWSLYLVAPPCLPLCRHLSSSAFSFSGLLQHFCSKALPQMLDCVPELPLKTLKMWQRMLPGRFPPPYNQVIL